MKSGSVLAALAAVALIVPFSNMAMADSGGFYLSVGAGVNLPETSDLRPDSAAASSNYDFDAGFAATGSAGYEFANGVRTEIELGYRGSDTDDIGGADVTTGLVMFNAFYELPLDGRVRPYIGAGLGVVRTNYDDTSPLTGVMIDDADTEIAAQAIIGISIEASKSIDVFLDYRFLQSGKLDLVSSTGEQVKATNKHHAIMAGLKYRMGTQFFAEDAR